MKEVAEFWSQVESIREREPEKAREAYAFVMAGLAWTVDRLPPGRLADPARRHLTGQELLAGLLRYAREEYGYLAHAVLAAWGLRNGGDVGRVVFQLVEVELLSKRPEDRVEDFAGGPDFHTALVEDFPWSEAVRLPRAATSGVGKTGSGGVA